MLANPADPRGYDAAVIPQPGTGVMDLCPDGRDSSGVELCISGLICRSMDRLLSMTGAPGDVVDYGEDARAWVGEAADEGTAAAHAQRLAIVYAREPTIDPGSIMVAIAQATRGSSYDFTITVNARTTGGQPVAFVMGVNGVSVDYLAALT